MKPEKSQECDGCGFGTKLLKFVPSRDGRGADHEDTPWSMRARWLCRLCYTGLGFEVQQGRVNHGIVQALNVIMERLDRIERRVKAGR